MLAHQCICQIPRALLVPALRLHPARKKLRIMALEPSELIANSSPLGNKVERRKVHGLLCMGGSRAAEQSGESQGSTLIRREEADVVHANERS